MSSSSARPGCQEVWTPSRDGGPEASHRTDTDADADAETPHRSDAGGASEGAPRGDADVDDLHHTDEAPADEHLPEDPEAVALDTELGDLGYPEGTRAKGEELVAKIEQGEVPPKDAVRATEANQQGLRELQQLQNDPSLTPEQKARIDRELAARLREQPDPTGNLPRDLQEARMRAQDPAGPRPPPEAAGGGSPIKTPTARGTIVRRGRSAAAATASPTSPWRC